MGKVGRRGKVRAFVSGGVVMAAVLGVTAYGTAASVAAPRSEVPSVGVSAKAYQKFTTQEVSTRGSGTSGGRTGDIDLAGKDDILGIPYNPADLKVYPNKGYNAANPTATYGTPVTINTNWGSQRWVGQGKVNGDAFPDVLAIDTANNLYVHKHSGTFSGLSTLNGAQLISGGWGDSDLVFVHDANGDKVDDIIARKVGTEDFYLHKMTVVDGVVKQAPAELLMQFRTSSPIIDAAVADMTSDGNADWVLRLQNGTVLVHDLAAGGGSGDVYLLSFGWTGMSSFTISDVNGDNKPDILGRVAANGNLNAYLNTGAWSPTADGTAYNTLAAPSVVSLQWNGIRIIT